MIADDTKRVSESRQPGRVLLGALHAASLAAAFFAAAFLRRNWLFDSLPFPFVCPKGTPGSGTKSGSPSASVPSPRGAMAPTSSSIHDPHAIASGVAECKPKLARRKGSEAARLLGEGAAPVGSRSVPAAAWVARSSTEGDAERS